MTLDVTTLGSGPRVVFVHGSVTDAALSWHKQRPLAKRWTLVLPNRPGYGASPIEGRVDFAADAPAIASLLDEPSHLVGHSYGGIVAMLAAVMRPECVRSLTVIEPPAFAVTRGEPETDAYVAQMLGLWKNRLDDPEAFLRRFAPLLGVDLAPRPLSPALLQGARLLLDERGPWEAELPLAELARSGIPMLVVSGGHHPVLERVCDLIAVTTGARRECITGAGHSVSRIGTRFNAVLESFWTSLARP